jgi:hypothetical protein
MMDNDRDHHHHNIYDGWVVLSVVGQLKWNSNVYYGLWVGRIVHELYDFLTDDDELMMMILLLLLQLFFKSLCRFLFIYLFINFIIIIIIFWGEANMKLVLLKKEFGGEMQL